MWLPSLFPLGLRLLTSFHLSCYQCFLPCLKLMLHVCLLPGNCSLLLRCFLTPAFCLLLLQLELPLHVSNCNPLLQNELLVPFTVLCSLQWP